jgi:hypothetical protein
MTNTPDREAMERDKARILERLRPRFERFMRRRHWLRFDMFLILSATFLSGFFFSYIVLTFHLNSMLFRYPMAVLASYLVFLGLMRLWLFYVSPSQKRHRHDDSDRGSYVCGSGGDAGPASSEPFAGRGGEFGGGGASGSFATSSGVADQGSLDSVIPGVAYTADQVADGSGGSAFNAGCETVSRSTAGAGGGGSGGSAAGGIWDAVGDGGDGDGLPIVFIILAAAVIGAGLGVAGYLVYHASFILCETALQFLLPTSLNRRSTIMAHPDWSGSVIRLTWKPFAAIFTLSFILAGLINYWFPEATKLSQVINTLLFYIY